MTPNANNGRSDPDLFGPHNPPDLLLLVEIRPDGAHVMVLRPPVLELIAGSIMADMLGLELAELLFILEDPPEGEIGDEAD